MRNSSLLYLKNQTNETLIKRQQQKRFNKIFWQALKVSKCNWNYYYRRKQNPICMGRYLLGYDFIRPRKSELSHKNWCSHCLMQQLKVNWDCTTR